MILFDLLLRSVEKKNTIFCFIRISLRLINASFPRRCGSKHYMLCKNNSDSFQFWTNILFFRHRRTTETQREMAKRYRMREREWIKNNANKVEGMPYATTQWTKKSNLLHSAFGRLVYMVPYKISYTSIEHFTKFNMSVVYTQLRNRQLWTQLIFLMKWLLGHMHVLFIFNRSFYLLLLIRRGQVCESV